MKTWMVIGIALMLFGCGKGEKEKCESKGSDWFWDESDKKCKEKTGGTSIAGTSAGEETPGVVTSEASCKLKPGYEWDSNSSQCKEKEYLVLMVPENFDEILLLGYSLYNYESINDYGDQLGVLVQLIHGVCIKIHKFDLFRIRIVVRRRVIQQGGTWTEREDVNVCIGSNKRGTDTDMRCEVGVYEVDGVSLKKLSPDKGSECLRVFDPSD